MEIENIIAFDSSVISSNTESIYYKKYLNPIIHSTHIRELTWKSNSDYFLELGSIIRKTWEIINLESKDYEISVRNLLSDFFAILSHIKKLESASTNSAYLLLEDRVQIILNFIHSNYSNDITLDDLATIANVSKSEVLRCFKSIINISVYV